MRKPDFCISENKDADQLRGYREADQHLCFRYIDSTIPYFLNSKFQASGHLLWLYSLVCIGPGRKPRRPVFSQRGSYHPAHLHSLISVFVVYCLRKQQDILSLLVRKPVFGVSYQVQHKRAVQPQKMDRGLKFQI